jgi:hypothetical protein
MIRVDTMAGERITDRQCMPWRIAVPGWRGTREFHDLIMQ